MNINHPLFSVMDKRRSGHELWYINGTRKRLQYRLEVNFTDRDFFIFMFLLKNSFVMEDIRLRLSERNEVGWFSL